MDMKLELSHLKGMVEGMRERIGSLEKELKEEPELSYQKELDALIENYSFYRVIKATCNQLELRYEGEATGPYTIEFTLGGGFTARPDNSRNSVFLVLEELRLLEALGSAFASCGDC